MSAEQYLHNLGFDPAMLLLISGVRCVGHDGNFTYATSINAMFESFSGGVDVQFEADFSRCRYDKLLIRQRVESLPLQIGALDRHLSISQTLHSAIHTSITSFYVRDNMQPRTQYKEFFGF